ncbi:hypothetical protein QBC39DRAFT_404270 [Podospora conica]|nr:hypothetical protein QBC39DRAFT_404270 [Schizothecium conicum]
MASPLPIPDDSEAFRYQAPLSRCGTGPGLIIIVDDHVDLRPHSKTLDPPPLEKWAEESYAVCQTRMSALESLYDRAFQQLADSPECTSTDKVGIIIISDDHSATLDTLTFLTSHPKSSSISALVLYGSAPPPPSLPFPTLTHLPGTTPTPTPPSKTHTYPPTTTPFFLLPSHPSYRPSSAAVAHTRTLTFLKPLVGGPFFDLEAIWDEHTRLEFAERSVSRTMATMVTEPYVNHVPTLTGGVGRAALTAFYRDHFIHSNAGDAGLELVSRTVGVDRVVDEFLFGCTHEREVDWLIPGIPPTGRKLSIPFTSVVNIRGDRLFHEHISWDQGTVLRQLGLMPEYLPFPYPVPGDEDGRRWEYRVPVAGVDTARKLVDEHAVPSNGMLAFGVREVTEVRGDGAGGDM